MATQTQKKTETKIVVPTGTTAKVIERQGNRTATYEAEIEQHEVEETDDTRTDHDREINADDLFENEEETVIEFPKTQLETMFEDLVFAVRANQQQDGFMAHVVRQPDSIGNSYIVSCNTLLDCGVFQFRTTDFFGFNGEIQRLNGNSGGIFNVKIFKVDRTPLKVARGRAINPIAREVGLLNYSVPNPQIVETQNGNGQSSEFMQFMQQTNQRFDQLLQQINKPKETSEIEKMLMQKAIDMVTNPPQQNNNNDPAQFMRDIMQQGVVMQAVGQGFAGMFNQTPPAPPEPSTMDIIMQVAETPVVQNILGSIGNISEQYAISKIGKGIPAQPNGTENPAQPTMNNETQELILDLIEELESDNPLNADNEFIAQLQADYPDAAEVVKESCQIMAFEQVLQMMILRTQKMQPSPFVEFLNIEETQKQNKYIWTERGEKLLERLKEFYEYVRSTITV